MALLFLYDLVFAKTDEVGSKFWSDLFSCVVYKSATELDSLSDSIHFLEKESLVQIFG